MSSTLSGPAELPALMRDRLEQRVEREELELPVLPEVASQVIQLSFDESCEVRRLANLIQRDQAMAAHVLRISNSALYGGGVRIVSLHQALARLGMAKIREIALLISCETKVFRVEGFDLRVRGLFKHALAAGSYAQEIARMRRRNAEEAFLCGLLSDFGRPVLLQALVDMKNRMGVRVSREAIDAASGEYHCRVGATLARAWKLPDPLVQSILHHHDPTRAGDFAELAGMTRLANDLAHLAVGPRKVEQSWIREHPTLEGLSLYPDQVDALIGMRDKIAEIVEYAG